jgi:hypothetical protein
VAKHILQLEVPPVYNEGIFIVEDISIYAANIPVTCQNLQITPPGYGTPTIISITQQNFRLVLNACTIGVAAPGGCNDICPNLPDGIYNLRYSVSPNTQVWVEYQYLRITHAINRLNHLLCEVDLGDCLPDTETEYYLKNIDTIRNYLISGQVNVNDKHQCEDGINQYRYALALMEKMSRRKPNCVNY